MTMTAQELTDDEIIELRIAILDYFSGETKTFADLLASGTINPYIETMGEARLRDFLSGLCDPAGFIFYRGATNSRFYRTTKMGRAMSKILKGELEMPDPDIE
jgi:hypothetical protein